VSEIQKIEEGLLGAYLKKDDLFQKCEHLVSDKLFSSKINKAAFKIIKSLHSEGKIPDHIIVSKKLQELGVKPGEIPYYGSDHKYEFQPENYVVILFEERIKKHLMKPLHDAYINMHQGSGSALELMSDIKSKINDIDLVLNNVSSESDISDVVDLAIKEIEDLKTSKTKPGYPTGLQKLDDIIGGLLPGVIVIGAPPSVGKTSLLVNIITYNGILSNVPIVFFSLEMPATQIVKNIFSNMLEINTMAMRDGGVDDDQMQKIKQAKNKFKSNVIIDDTPAITWQYVDAKLAKIRKKVPIEKTIVVMIDYIQLMDNVEDEKKGRTDEAIMALRMKGLMNMWKKHNVCIIELSQLGREVVKEKRRPRMIDLKESGSIEANANVVMLLHRPDYYEENPTDENGKSLKGIMEIIVDKNRGGRRAFVYVNFLGKYSKLTSFNKEDWEKSSPIL